MLPAFGLAGSFSAGGFKTKAEALHFAIVFTATSTESGDEPNYDKAKTLFDFITSNVQLPDVQGDASEKFYEQAVGMLAALKPEPEKCKDSPEPCDIPDGPPARPAEPDYAPDRRADYVISA